MRKFVALLLMVVALIPTVVFSETVVVSAHNNIKFGMTADEIRMIEQSNGFVEFSLDAYKGKIAGQDDASVFYYFNSADGYPVTEFSNGGMYAFHYVFGESAYGTMYDGLTGKYGVPDAVGVSNRIKFPLIDGDYLYTYENSSTDGFHMKYSNLAQWLLHQENGSVLISICNIEGGMDFWGETVWLGADCYVRYEYISPERVTQYNDSQNQLINDL